jgi:hypothetical protein
LTFRADKWGRVEDLLENDEDAFKEEPFCIQLPNEDDAAYLKRKEYFPTTFTNPSQDLISAPGDTLFKNGYKLEFEGGDSSMLSSFAENCVQANDKVPFARYLKDYVAVGLRAYGTVFTVINKPRYEAKSREDERESGMPYLVNIRPADVVNYVIWEGELQWFAYKRHMGEPWLDPTRESPGEDEVTCIWTRDRFIVIKKNGREDKTRGFDHKWGFVPVVIQGSFLASPDAVLGEWAFDQTSNMLITANNLRHIAVYELLKHGASLLLVNEEAIMAANMTADRKGNTKLKKQDKGGVLPWAGTIPPAYLVKELAVEEAKGLAKEYFDDAVENERDLKSVAKKGTTGEQVAESGFAKMIDREPLEANLCGLAEDLEVYTDKVFTKVKKTLNEEKGGQIGFDREFDLRSFKQKLEEIKESIENKMGQVSPTGLTESFKRLAPEITTNVEKQDVIMKEMEENVPVVFAEDAAMRDMIDKETGGEKTLEQLEAELKTLDPIADKDRIAGIEKQIAAMKAAGGE